MLWKKKKLFEIFNEFRFHIVLHLAAQAGVRYSIEQPKSYINSNLIGFFNIIELCRKFEVKNFIYASSSSVYGGNKKYLFLNLIPLIIQLAFMQQQKSNEVIAHCYSHLYGIPTTGLRFFTVYGPWGSLIWHQLYLRKLLRKVFQ